MKEKKVKWIVLLPVLVLVAVVADIAIRLSVLAIPLKFIMKIPDCLNKLNEAANLTNISIVPPGTLETRRRNLSTLRTK